VASGEFGVGWRLALSTRITGIGRFAGSSFKPSCLSIASKSDVIACLGDLCGPVRRS
jgi:hypothetical protein